MPGVQQCSSGFIGLSVTKLGLWLTAAVLLVGESDSAQDKPGEIRRFEGHENVVRCLALSPDGKRLLTGSEDRTLRLWEVDTGKGIGIYDGHSAGVRGVAFASDGKRGVVHQ
jgi:WD40 repeat protein